MFFFKKKPKLKKRYFEAASVKPRTTGVWDFLNKKENPNSTLINRSRNLYINNPYAKKGIDTLVHHSIGKGIIPQCDNEALERIYKKWVKGKCDLAGRHNFYSLQSLVLRTVITSGECFVRKVIVKDQEFPLRLQVLEPEFLDSSKGSKGFIYDSQGKVKAYWFYENHPQDDEFTGSSKMVKDTEVLHIFSENRPGETRGTPWLTSVMLRLNDYADYEHAQLTRIKMASCFVGIVSDLDSSDEFLDEVEDLQNIEPGTFKFAPANKSITFNSPPSPDAGNYPKDVLMGISTGLNLPYFLLLGDFSQVNYSSSRMGMNEFYKKIDSIRWHMIIPQLCEPVFDWFCESLLLTGNKAQGMCKHTPPSRAVVDITKEVEGFKEGIRSGLTTQSRAIQEFSGLDPGDVFEEIRRDNETLKKLKINLDTQVIQEPKSENKKR